MIKNFIKQYLWFWKESYSFMEGHNKLYIAWGCIWKAPKFAVDMVKWERLTPEQKEAWYVSGEGRTFDA